MGLAICEAVEQHARADITLKWPNDVYLNGRKVAGILIELAGGPQARLAIGVGLNVNNSVRTAPVELQSSAASMIDTLSDPVAPFDRTIILVECLQRIEKNLHRFVADDPNLPRLWRERSLLTGRHVQIDSPRTSISGICEGIADDGALLISTAQGVQPCYGGVVAKFA